MARDTTSVNPIPLNFRKIRVFKVFSLSTSVRKKNYRTSEKKTCFHTRPGYGIKCKINVIFTVISTNVTVRGGFFNEWFDRMILFFVHI